jgi:hypothetical protein
VIGRLRPCNAELCRAKLEEHRPPRRRLGRLLERSSEPGDGSGRGASAERVPRHPAKKLDPLGVAGRLGLDDLGRYAFLGRATRSEDARSPRVRLCAFVGADVRVDRLPDDRVRELEPLVRREDRERDEQVSSLGRLVLGQLGQASGLAEARTVAGNRDRAHEGGGRRRSLGEAQEHRLGNGRRPDFPDAGGLAGVGRESPLPDLVQELLEEERVPPVASRQAAANSDATSVPSVRSHSRTIAPELSGRGRSTVVSGPAARRASSVTLSPLRVEAITATARPSSRGAR